MFENKPHYDASRGPWGLLSTIGLSVGIMLAFIALQNITVLFFAAGFHIYNRSLNVEQILARYLGLLSALSLLTSAPICTWLILFCVHARRGPEPRIYLGLKRFSLKQLGIWLVLFTVLVVAGDVVTNLLGKKQPEVMLQMVRTAQIAPLLWLAIIVAGPIFEELFFRGFLFRGIEWSPLGRDGAIILTALLWAVVHQQYDPYFIGQIFLMGVVLGYARARTGSTLLTIALHAANNLYSTIQIYYLIGHGR